MGLSFGTAGVRALLGPGPDRMNADTFTHVVTAIARYLRDHYEPGQLVVVAGDARHQSAEFVSLACTVLTDHGLQVRTPGEPVATPVLAAAVRSRGAVAGLQVTASHNPADYNGLKMYGPDGAQIISPTDTAIEGHLTQVVAEGLRARAARHERAWIDADMAADYVRAVSAALPVVRRSPRVALTAMHGVGGDTILKLLAAVGVDDVTVVAHQQQPDPHFPSVPTPNPERPGAVAEVLALADTIDADVALALDPDADRCATGIRNHDGAWRMLDGDNTGILLANHILNTTALGTASDRAASSEPVVASTVVSSRMPSLLVPARGGRYVTTLTGFKWLVRADPALRYAYEEAIGHCVLPGVVADKDGLSAAALWCHLVSTGPTVPDQLTALHNEFGWHFRDNNAVPITGNANASTILDHVAGRLAERGTLSPLAGTTGLRLETEGARAILRPSGTEPLLKYYCESWTTPHPDTAQQADTRRRLRELTAAVQAAVAT